MRRSWVIGSGVIAVGALVMFNSCSLPGNERTDEQAEILAIAISHPPQDTADGFARAALATPLGQSPSFAVLEASDLPARDFQDPLAQLVVRIHVPAFKSKSIGQSDRAAFDACYGMDFNRYGIIDTPERVSCPENATPITPPPQWQIPDGAERALQAVLTALPPRPSAAELRSALRKRLPEPGTDPATGKRLRPPQVDVRVDGANVGVLLRAGEGFDLECLLGSREAGEVRTRTFPSPARATDDGPYCTPHTTP